MKATSKLLVAALAAAGAMVAAEVPAQESPGARGARGATAMPRSSAAPAGNPASVDHAGRSGSGGRWSGEGRGGHWGGGSRWAGHHGHWGGYRHWSPRWSFYFGVPVLWGGGYWGGGYWGAPYWYDAYPGSTIVYREVEREASFPEHRIGPANPEVPRGEGFPTQGPLYMNYCESAKAYFPKVTTCPEGWKLAKPTE